jgi:predicted nuclease of restriction endonuclease-like (RecB) superfamily
MADKNRSPSLPTRTGVKSKTAQVSRTSLPLDYIHFLEELKARIKNARIKASLSVNRELILLYWTIGRDIIQKQQTQGWGAKVIDHLAYDLQKAFPGVSGLSRTNVYRMRAFFLAYSGINSIIPQPVGQINGSSIPQAVGQIEQDGPPQPLMEIPWGQNVILIERIKDPFVRLWYASAVDALLRHPSDNPSIGIILCKTKKKLIAEYALRNTMTPIGVSEYTLTRTIPSEYKPNLPSIEDLEKELGDGE